MPPPLPGPPHPAGRRFFFAEKPYNTGRCEHFSDKELVGSVYENKLNAEKVNAWKEERHDIPECESCPLYPLCINLKKCERTKHGCSEVYRTLRIERIKDQMKAEYQRLR